MSPSVRHLGSPARLSVLTALAAFISFYGCGGDDLKCGGPFCVSPGPAEATKLRMSSGDGQTGAPGRELPQPIEVVVTDDDGRPVADVEVSFNVSQGGGSLSESATQSDIQGHARVNWTLGPEPGAQNIQAAAAASSGSQLDGSPLTISAQAVRPLPVRIVLRSPPPEVAQNGIPFSQQPVVELLDADDQPVPQVQVTASIASGGGTLSGTMGVGTDAAGQATYTDLAILGAKGPRTLRFNVTDPSLEVVSGTIQVDAGTATEIAGVEPLVYEGIVSSPVTPAPSVVVKDAAGNAVPGVPVTFTPDRDASVSPTTVTTNELGVAQVTSWTLGTAANVQYSLSARIVSSAVAPVLFSATAKAGAAGRLQILTQPPSSAQNGAPFDPQPVVQITDQNGNPAPQSDVTIRATVSSGPSGILENASATTDGSGKATFSQLTLTGKAGNYTLTFSASGLAGVNSTSIALTAGPATMLALTSAAPTARSQRPLSPQPTIQLQDASANPVAQAGIPIVASMTGAGTLGGTTTITTDANGQATFTDLTITGAPGSRTLSFSSTGPALDPVSVQVELPSVASIDVQTPAPSSVIVGTTIANAPVWLLKDAAGQSVADAPVVISASEGGSVVPTTGASNGDGIVQVQSWTLATLAGDQYVLVTVTADLADTVHVQGTSGGAVTLQKISGDAQTGTVNTTLDSLLVVRVTDQYGNGVPGVTVQWRSCDGTGTYDPQTDVNGYSGASQPTGAEPGTFCTRATVSGLNGSPVEFTYTVTPAATSPSQLRTNERSALRASGPAPVAPQRRAMTRPSAR